MSKPTKWHVLPAKTQNSLGIRTVWSESSLCAQLVAKDPRFLHADSEDSDQPGRMPRLIWVFAGRTVILLVLSWGGSVMVFDLYPVPWRNGCQKRRKDSMSQNQGNLWLGEVWKSLCHVICWCSSREGRKDVTREKAVEARRKKFQTAASRFYMDQFGADTRTHNLWRRWIF